MKVHYRSRLARLFLPKTYAAITIGSRVFTPMDSLSQRMLAHERVHVEQWRRHGFFGFALRYLWNHLKYGYQRNPFEVEAGKERRA